MMGEQIVDGVTFKEYPRLDEPLEAEIDQRLKAELAKTYADEGQFIAMQAERDALKAENERLRKGYTEAIADIEYWGAHTDAYFKEKWGLDKTIAEHREALANSSVKI